MIAYAYEPNAILAEPLKNRTGPLLLTVYQNIYNRLELAGFKPMLHILDNEASAAFKTFLAQQKVDFQLVPPQNHRRNAAERAIQTFKNHFIAGLASTHREFPMHLWDCLLPQAIITLNLLRPSQWNPSLSAHQQLFGNFDYNRTLLAPPGSKVIIHEPLEVRQKWDLHGKYGWCIGPSVDHYRCFKIYVPST